MTGNDGIKVSGRVSVMMAEGCPLVRDSVCRADIRMPGTGGIEATRRIRAAHPDLMLLLMSTYDVEDRPTGAADCGAAANLHEESLNPDLLTRFWRAAN
jgi:DNA-binding NarL/FixJ family response regulator